MSDFPSYVIRHKTTHLFRAHIDAEGPYTEKLQAAATFSREEFASQECNYDTETTVAIEDILPEADGEAHPVPASPTPLEQAIADILWPNGEDDIQWDSDTFGYIAQAFHTHRPDLTPYQP